MLINPPFCFLPAIYPQIAFFTREKATDKWHGVVKILSTKPKYRKTVADIFLQQSSCKKGYSWSSKYCPIQHRRDIISVRNSYNIPSYLFLQKKKKISADFKDFPHLLHFASLRRLKISKRRFLKIPKISHLGYPRNHSTLQSHWKSVPIWSDNVYFQRAWFLPNDILVVWSKRFSETSCFCLLSYPKRNTFDRFLWEDEHYYYMIINGTSWAERALS